MHEIPKFQINKIKVVLLLKLVKIILIMSTSFTVALIAITTLQVIQAPPSPTRVNLAYEKPVTAFQRWLCPDGSYEDDNEITDGFTLPTDDYREACPARRFRHALTPGARSVKIDLGTAKHVRSIYLAVPESPSDNNLNNLGIYVGNIGNSQDTRCWLGAPTEPKISQWIECGAPRVGLTGRYIYLHSMADEIILYELMAYSDRLVQQYSHQYNSYTSINGVTTTGAVFTANDVQQLFKLKNHVQTDKTCFKVINNWGRFQMDWKARFEVKTIVYLSKAPAFGRTQYDGPVNDIGIRTDCTEQNGCTSDFKSYNGVYDNPELKIANAQSINRIMFRSQETSSGIFTHCMFAVFSPCDCNTTSYQDINLHADFRNPASLLEFNTETAITIDPKIVTTVQSWVLKDVQTLYDSVSLVCSANGDFCGLKELFLWFNNTKIPFTQLPVGWSYDPATRILAIDPLLVTQFGVFHLRARLQEFPTVDGGFAPTTTVFTIIESRQCQITASTVQNFSGRNLDPAQLLGALQLFTATDCNELQYSIVPISFNDDTPTTSSVIKSIDLEEKQFLFESGLISQVGRHKFKVKAQDTVDIAQVAWSNTFTVTVEADLISQSLAVVDSASGSVLTDITYRVGSGEQIFTFETTPQRSSNLWTPKLQLQNEQGEELTGDFQSYLDCKPDLNLCLYFDRITQALRLNANRATKNLSFEFVISVVDSGGAESKQVKQALLIELLCQIEQIIAVQPLLKYFYRLGSGPQDYLFSSFRQVPDCDLPLTIKDVLAKRNPQFPLIVTQTGIKIDLQSEEELNGQTFEWQIYATADGVVSSEGIVSITLFNEKDQNQIHNYLPPYLVSKIPSPLPIPCLADTENANVWKFKFPKAVSDTGVVYINLQCPTLKDLFETETQSHILQLKLRPSSDLFQFGVHFCELILSNQFKEETKHLVQFWHQCRAAQNTDKSTVIPEVKSTKISDEGQVVLVWNTDMNITTLNQTDLSVRLLPGSEQTNLNHLNITNFTVNQTTNTTLTIQIQLETPGLVSLHHYDRDKLQIQFKNLTQIVSTRGIYAVKELVEEEMPRQMTDYLFYYDASYGVTVAKYILVASIVITNPFFIYFTSSLLSLIEPLGLQIHLALFDVNQPANVRKFYADFLPYVSADILPTEPLYEKIFKNSEINDTPFNAQFETVGYSSVLAINNIGSIFVLIVLIPFYALVLFILKAQKCSKKIRDEAERRWNGLVWNGIINFFYQNYLVMTLVGWLGIMDLRLGSNYTWAENFSSALSITLAAHSVVFPIGLYKWLLNHISYRYCDGKNNWVVGYQISKYCGLLSEMKPKPIRQKDKDLKYLCFVPIVPLILRLVLVLGTVFMPKSGGFMCAFLLWLAIMEMSYIMYQKPYNEPSRYCLMLFNYATLILICYLILLLTEFVNYSVAEKAGNLIISLTQLSIVVNVLYNFSPVLKKLTLIIKRQVARYRQRRQRQLSVGGQQPSQEIVQRRQRAADQKPVKTKVSLDQTLLINNRTNLNMSAANLPVLSPRQKREQAIDELVSIESEANDPEQPRTLEQIIKLAEQEAERAENRRITKEVQQMFRDQPPIIVNKGQTTTNSQLSQSALDFFKRSTTPERKKTETLPPYTPFEIEQIERQAFPERFINKPQTRTVTENRASLLIKPEFQSNQSRKIKYFAQPSRGHERSGLEDSN